MSISKRSMTLIAYLFLRLPPAKNLVRYMWKKSCFRLRFQKEHGKRVSTLFKSKREPLAHIYCSTGSQFSGKRSLLVVWKSLKLFVNTMSAIDKCLLRNRDYLMQPIHIQLSQNLEIFLNFLMYFPNLC